jgi:hypothetical protein
MISHKYKCIFIHIPKTAGTSIEQKLGHFDELKRGVQDHRSISDIEPVSFVDLTRACVGLDSSRMIRLLKKLIKDNQANFRRCYDTYFKFSFVRNPWARVFSWYKNVMRDEHHKRRFDVHENCTFKEFITNHLDQAELKPQLFWLTDKQGKIPLDFIGRFENLADDFSYVADKIGLKNKTLPKLVSGDGQSYSDAYDSETIDIVAKRYKDEIKRFNFEYGKR